MTICPATPSPSTNNCTPPALDALVTFIEALGQGGSPCSDIDELELHLRELTMSVETEVVARELAKFDVDCPTILVAGVVHRRVMQSETTYHASCGDVRVARTLYRSRPDQPCVAPVELRAGIVAGRWTPTAARQATWAVAHLTPQDAANMFEMVGCMVPSKSSLDRLPKAVSEQWEEHREAFDESLREQATIPVDAVSVGISLDGVMVPMKDGQRTEKRAATVRRGKKPCGPAGYKEASCATLSFYDREGIRLDTWRQARMPQKGKVDLKAWLAAETGFVLGLRPDLQLMKVSDGARDNWTFLDGDTIPAGESAIDFFHAAGHLSEAMAAAYGEGSPRYHARFQKLRRILLEDDDGVEKVIRALRHLHARFPRRQRITKELAYFRRYRHKMRYAKLAAQNLPIGSGVVEAACKTLVTERMKRSGMRWRLIGGQAILTFRALAQSGRFNRGWSMLTRSYEQTVEIPDEHGLMAA